MSEDDDSQTTIRGKRIKKIKLILLKLIVN